MHFKRSVVTKTSPPPPIRLPKIPHCGGGGVRLGLKKREGFLPEYALTFTEHENLNLNVSHGLGLLTEVDWL